MSLLLLHCADSSPRRSFEILKPRCLRFVNASERKIIFSTRVCSVWGRCSAHKTSETETAPRPAAPNELAPAAAPASRRPGSHSFAPFPAPRRDERRRRRRRQYQVSRIPLLALPAAAPSSPRPPSPPVRRPLPTLHHLPLPHAPRLLSVAPAPSGRA